MQVVLAGPCMPFNNTNGIDAMTLLCQDDKVCGTTEWYSVPRARMQGGSLHVFKLVGVSDFAKGNSAHWTFLGTAGKSIFESWQFLLETGYLYRYILYTIDYR